VGHVKCTVRQIQILVAALALSLGTAGWATSAYRNAGMRLVLTAIITIALGPWLFSIGLTFVDVKNRFSRWLAAVSLMTYNVIIPSIVSAFIWRMAINTWARRAVLLCLAAWCILGLKILADSLPRRCPKCRYWAMYPDAQVLATMPTFNSIALVCDACGKRTIRVGRSGRR
jgi:hypothetical protein